MRAHLSIAALILGLAGPWTGARAAEQPAMIELVAPHPAGPGDAVQLEITTGQLPRGARLAVIGDGGQTLGALSPYGPGTATTATVPVPPSALADGRLRLRLEVREPGAPPRPPHPGEVERLHLVVVPHGK
jgi:hypothetical protein